MLAVVALLAGKTLGWAWMDPLMDVVGGLLIARWSFGLLGATSAVLLAGELQIERRHAIQEVLEGEGDTRVADLHVWRVGPRHLAASLSIVTAHPRPPAHYKALLARYPDLVHLTVEVQPCEGGGGGPLAAARGAARHGAAGSRSVV